MCRADCGAGSAKKNAAEEIVLECEWQALREAGKLAGVTADEAAQSIAEFEMWAKSMAMSFLWCLAIDPKWEHLAAHAQKLRTRKKYRRKIAREKAKLAAGIECGAVSVSEDGFNVASRV